MPGPTTYYTAPHGVVVSVEELERLKLEPPPPDVGRSPENPHIHGQEQGAEFSSLQNLTQQALRRFGDFAPASVNGDVAMMFIEFANLVIEDVRIHPYWPEDCPLDYYIALPDTRPVPDQIVRNGLLAHYALQQGSQKAQVYMPMYTQALNQILYNRKFGNKQHELRQVDGASNPQYVGGDPAYRITGATETNG